MEEVNNHPDQTAKGEIFSSMTALMRKVQDCFVVSQREIPSFNDPDEFFFLWCHFEVRECYGKASTSSISYDE